MNSVMIGVKRFFKNKNTVTIFAVIICLVIIYWAYWWRIEKATEPRMVPYATKTLSPRTLVTSEMVGTRKVPGKVITANVITESSLIIGKYVSNKVEIPADSLFYNNTLVTWDELPSSLYEDIPDGHTIVALPVTVETTYGNSIFTGNYIDLYYSGYDDSDGKLLLGKFIESIKVLAVTDSSYNNIFEKSTNVEKPKYLIFSIPEDMHLLLRKALYTSGTIFPVPRNADYSNNPSETRISSTYLKDMILAKTINVAEKDLSNIELNDPNNTNNTNTNTNKNTNGGE